MKFRILGLVALLLPLSAPAFAEGVAISVHKDPSCGCCTAWADLAREAGYQVTLIEAADMGGVKDKAGVPGALWSCHTAMVEGYVVEGHVPFDALARLLETRPDVTGIAVPGMPEGSPGMGDDPAARYDVVAWGGAAGVGALFHQAGVQ